MSLSNCCLRDASTKSDARDRAREGRAVSVYIQQLICRQPQPGPVALCAWARASQGEGKGSNKLRATSTVRCAVERYVSVN